MPVSRADYTVVTCAAVHSTSSVTAETIQRMSCSCLRGRCLLSAQTRS
jgi:hypothetical protein